MNGVMGSSTALDLSTLLEQQARADCGRNGYAFHASADSSNVERLSFRDLAERSRRLAAALAGEANASDRCMLLFPPGLEYVSAFFACLRAAVVAVPAYPPSKRNIHQRFRAILRDAQPSLILAPQEILDRLASLTDGWPEMEGVRCRTLDQLEARDAAGPQRPVDADTLAFLQYTSGSTGDPKGVQIRHGNLLHNQQLIQRAFGTHTDSVIVGWLPLYHDMGLIGTVLQPLFVGADCHLMSPLAFLQRPLRWLQLISRVGGTVSGGPSFGYGLCADKAAGLAKRGAADLEGLDLSRWEVAFNGSEPVDAATLDRFAATFEPYGFRRRAAFPCYGLAEATLFVSGSAGDAPRVEALDSEALAQGRVQPDVEGRRLVSSGRVADDLAVRIVDPELCREVAPGTVGEIWVAGDSVATGYWGRPEVNREIFQATLADPSDREPGEPGGEPKQWLRTGDLGFFRDGELFISGRAKDLIILRGRNIYPQDVERTVAASHPALVAHGAAAFGIDTEGGEALVVVQEIERRHHEAASEALAAIRRHLAEQEGLRAHTIVLIRQRTLPKTTSGKVQRRACREAFLSDQLTTVLSSTEAQPLDDTNPDPSWMVEDGGVQDGRFEDSRVQDGRDASSPSEHGTALDQARRLTAQRLQVPFDGFDDDRPLVELGLDSLAAMELADTLGSAGLSRASLTLESLLEGATLRQIVVEETGVVESPGAEGPSTRSQAASDLSGTTPADAVDPGRLSVGEAAIVFLEQLRPEATRYNVARAVRVVSVDTDRLLRALTEVAEARPELGFGLGFDTEGQPRWQPRQGSRLTVVEHSLTASNPADLQTLLQSAAFEPFDLERDPLLRVVVVRGDAPEASDHLMLVAHHLAVDFLSLAGLLADVKTRLMEMETGQPSTVVAAPAAAAPEETPDTTGRFAHWQRTLLAGPRGDALRHFWRSELADLPSPLELPIDRPPPRQRQWRAEVVHGAVDAATWGRARALARRHGVTPFALVLAVLQTLLARLTDRHDFLLASPVSTPGPLPGLRPLGYRVNLLPLRSSFEPDGRMTFTDLLGAAQRRVNAALAHRDLPFAHIAEAVGASEAGSGGRDGEALGMARMLLAFYGQPPGAPGGLAEAAAGVDGAPLALTAADAGEVEGVSGLTGVALAERPALFDLQLNVVDSATGACKTSLELDRELFDRSTGQRLLDLWGRVLVVATETPEQPLVDLPLLTPSERAEILAVGSGGPQVSVPAGPETGDLAAWVRHQMAQTPEAIALWHGADRWTYGTLAHKTRALARQLHQVGVAPGDRVAVCLERTPNLVVTLLAILDRGGVFVPLDPAYPLARLDTLVTDSGARHLVSDLELSKRWEHQGLSVVAPSTAEPESTAGDLPPVHRPPEALAYLIYTSGSTGQPKAVGIRQGAVVAMLAWAQQAFSHDEFDFTLAATSITFDLSIFEIFLPLVSGTTVVLVDNALALTEMSPNGRSSSEADDSGSPPVTLVNTVPSALDAVLDSGTLPASVRTINLAGEALAADLATRVHTKMPGVRLVNLYGPSEDTTYSTIAEIGPAEAARPPIGRAIAGTQARVVDRWGHLRPLGLSGELWLGGAGLARGYLGQPAKTAAAFVPDPWSTTPGARLYRTGDLVIQHDDGRLDFLGRRDHQVKIRGFRIELGEIETRLRALDTVLDAVVVGRPGADGLPQLVAYVVGPAESASGQLRESLADRLPRHMVPEAWVALDALPRTPNGKLDRRALPAPTATKTSGAAPADALEALVADQFATVLERPDVGVDDSFFALGGHSLLASRLAARLRKACDTELAVSAVFEDPTPRQLARRLREHRSEGTRWPDELPAASEPALLAPGQERMWLHQQVDPESPLYNLAGSLAIEGPLDRSRLAHALVGWMERHAILRTRFRQSAGQPRMETVDAAAGLPAGLLTVAGVLPTVDLAGLPKAVAHREAHRIAQREARRGFDLAHQSPWRRLLLVESVQQHRLVVVLHHLVADGESLRGLLQELAARFVGAPLPEAGLPFARVAAWRRTLAEGDLGAAAAEAWHRELEGAPAIDLPWDHRPNREGSAESLAGFQVTELLEPSVGEGLRRLARDQGVSRFIVVVGLVAESLARLGAGRDLVLGTPVAGRDRDDLASTVGPLVEVVPLRLRWSAMASVGALLDEVRQRVLGTLDRHHEPLPTDLEPPPVVVSLERAWPTLTLGDATARCQPLSTGTAKFDLAITVVEQDNGGLDLGFELRRSRLDHTTARRWVGRLARLARELSQGVLSSAGIAERSLADFAGLDRAERHQLAVEWNTHPEADDLPVVASIEQWGVTRAGEPAVTAGDTTLTYGELVERAQRLAGVLLAQDLGDPSTLRDRVIALHLGRSLDLVVAQVGVLMAGAAYLPLDPQLPAERLATMVRDSGAVRVLTHTDVEPLDLGVESQCLTGLASALAEPSTTSPKALPVLDSQLAYLIYTSGSTGEPKGVATSRRALRHLVGWHRRAYGRVGQRTTQLAGLGFDAAVWEVWPALAGGAHLHLIDAERSQPARLAECLNRHRIESTFLPTPLLEALLAEGHTLGPDLALLLTGGDRLRATPPAEATYRLINHYGPTECSVVASAGTVLASDGPAAAPPSLGRPIDGLRIVVVGPLGDLAPLGVPGELVLSGVGLARGYLGRPGRTAASFVPDPWSQEPGARAYRTGDRVRLLADGRLEFLGRLDRQIEVRGHRVEPGEIEVRLRRWPEIDDALVVQVTGQLVAYLKTAAGKTAPPETTLRQGLREQLPAHMVPTVYFSLETWPLNANGKIDQRALPRPESRGPEEGWVAPRTTIEALLAQVWAEVLEVPKVGVETPFFDLGGHSLQVTRVLTRVRDTFGVEVAVSDFLAEPTVAGLTKQLAAGLLAQADPNQATSVLADVGGGR